MFIIIPLLHIPLSNIDQWPMTKMTLILLWDSIVLTSGWTFLPLGAMPIEHGLWAKKCCAYCWVMYHHWYRGLELLPCIHLYTHPTLVGSWNASHVLCIKAIMILEAFSCNVSKWMMLCKYYMIMLCMGSPHISYLYKQRHSTCI
jgi:hypothetical protein